MRLTLRTLLAYLDDVLEPGEAQQLGEKIQESEFATKLVHRIRECMRQDKLGAPRLQGRAAGLDANTVSEYLDNTLSAERIVDFEKYSLESDVHLAETACCHQILALVLGEPALVDPESRRRIYNLLSQSDARQTPQAAAAQGVQGRPADLAQPASRAADGRPRKKAEVPDYLRTVSSGPSAWWKIAAVLLVAVLLVCVVAMAIGPLWRGNDPSKAGVSRGEGAKLPLAASGRDATKVEIPQSDPEQGDLEKTGTAKTGTVKTDSIERPKDKPKQNGGPNQVDPPKLPETRPPLVAPDNPLRKKEPVPDNPPEEGKVAQLTSLESVLFRLDRQANRWSRVPAGGALKSNDLLVCPPACVNTLSLRGDVTVHVLGDTRLELLRSAGPDQAPGIRLHHGRIRLMVPGEPKSPLVLHAGQRQARVTFASDGAVLAVEVRPVRIPGSDPQSTPARAVVDLIMGNGRITWEEPERPPLSLDAPARRTLGLAAGEAQPEGQPEWIVRPEPLLGTEQLGLKTLEEALDGKAALDVAETLRDWVVVPQSERHTLAYRWLISIDRFDDAVTALSHPDRRQAWSRIIEHLRQAVARDRETAAAVQAALKQARGEKAGGLYRMLWGYSEQDLKQDQAEQLVNYLNHLDLDYRVVSSWCLCDITGRGFNVFYRPDSPAELREQDVRRWKLRLEKGEIVPKKK